MLSKSITINGAVFWALMGPFVQIMSRHCHHDGDWVSWLTSFLSHSPLSVSRTLENAGGLKPLVILVFNFSHFCLDKLNLELKLLLINWWALFNKLWKLLLIIKVKLERLKLEESQLEILRSEFCGRFPTSGFFCKALTCYFHLHFKNNMCILCILWTEAT